MAFKELIAALSMIVATSPGLASVQTEQAPGAGAPAAPAGARYCLRTEVTGTRIGSVMCLTREEWAEGDVDVDKEWAENGVRVLA